MLSFYLSEFTDKKENLAKAPLSKFMMKFFTTTISNMISVNKLNLKTDHKFELFFGLNECIVLELQGNYSFQNILVDAKRIINNLLSAIIIAFKNTRFYEVEWSLYPF